MATVTWRLVLACVLFSFAFACPPEQLIRPCRCRGNSISCKGTIGQGILDRVFWGMGDAKVTDLTLIDSQVDYIPVSAIEENGIRRIIVYDSVISQLFEEVPSEKNELALLMLDNVTLQNGLLLPQLKPLQHLESLYVKDTDIPVIEREFGDCLSQKIKLVSFVNTKTRSIDLAFVGKSKLEDIRIVNASLTSMKRVTFPYPSRRLQDLSFDGNQIETLPDDQFSSMYQLRRVSLANNRISQVSESVFGEVFDQLKLLNLDGNPIKCDCSIKWLTTRDRNTMHLAGKCVEPQSLAGRNLYDLKQSDLPNC